MTLSGISEEAKQTARAAAKADDLALGAWVERAVVKAAQGVEAATPLELARERMRRCRGVG